jgi:Fic-DOC domain mobile mystery protein B
VGTIVNPWEQIPDETPIDISGLIQKHISNRGELSIAEAANILEPTVKYLAGKPTRRQAPFTLKWVYKLHREMFGKVWQWAGRRRQQELNIGVPHYQIDTQLQNLLNDLIYWRDNTKTPLSEQAAMLHHRSVQIHPFQNGNGRWARMLANIWLRQQGSSITAWPDEVIGEVSTIRAEYIEAIKAADNGNYAPLIALHERFKST